MRMKEIIKIMLLTVILFGVAFGDLASEEGEPLNQTRGTSSKGDSPKYDFESLKVINLMKKSKFTVITTNGKKHKGRLEVTDSILIVHKSDSRLTANNLFVEEVSIPFYQIAEIQYNPKRKVHLMGYFLCGLEALVIFAAIAIHGID